VLKLRRAASLDVRPLPLPSPAFISPVDVPAGALEASSSAVHIISNEEGWIATVQSMHTLPRDRAGRVLNAKGEVVAVVHQYDRSDQLKQQYARQYVWLEDNVLNLK
jgi:hypothetical protein